jgi:hypothetical protein
MGRSASGSGVNQSRGRAARGRGPDLQAITRCPYPGLLTRPLLRCGGQGPDLPVAHRAQDAGEQLAGRRDLGDVPGLAAAAADDGVLEVAGRAAGGLALDGLHHRPPQGRGALLGVCPRATLTSDSRCRGGGSPAQPQLAGAGEPGDVTDLGDDHGGQDRADPRQPQHRLVRRVTAEEAGDHLIEHAGLRREPGDELPQRGDLARVGRGGFSAPSHVSPKAPNTSEQGTGMPSLAGTACTRSLADDRIRTSLTLYRVSSRSSRTCGGATPRLGQPAQPQQVGQVGAVPLVVLDAAAGERLDPQRVGQVHLRPGARQRVRAAAHQP